MVSVLSFGLVILSSTYSGNLIASFTVHDTQLPFTTLQVTGLSYIPNGTVYGTLYMCVCACVIFSWNIIHASMRFSSSNRWNLIGHCSSKKFYSVKKNKYRRVCSKMATGITKVLVGLQHQHIGIIAGIPTLLVAWTPVSVSWHHGWFHGVIVDISIMVMLLKSWHHCWY